jgi:hypothetical protein
VNNLLLAGGDTVLVEQETYGGALTKLTGLGVKRSASRSTRRDCGSTC